MNIIRVLFILLFLAALSGCEYNKSTNVDSGGGAVTIEDNDVIIAGNDNDSNADSEGNGNTSGSDQNIGQGAVQDNSVNTDNSSEGGE